MPIAAPADRRFRRAHVKPVRRRGLSKRSLLPLARLLLVAAAVGYAGYRGRALTVQAHLLEVNKIVVRGNERLSSGEVLALLDGLRGQNLIMANLGEWRERLLTSPWVADAGLRRVLPSTVEVMVVERRPMGIGRLGRDLYLVDNRGLIIDEYGPNYAEFDLPIIDGLAAPLPAQGGPSIDEARADLAARLLAAVSARRDLVSRISQIDVSDKRDAVVVLEGETALIRLGDAQFLERLQSYVDLAPALHERVPDIDYVDLRFDERVYVRPSAPIGRPTLVKRVAAAGPRAARKRSSTGNGKR